MVTLLLALLIFAFLWVKVGLGFAILIVVIGGSAFALGYGGTQRGGCTPRYWIPPDRFDDGPDC